ncbi:MAG: hypothetical protein AAF311_07290, partial [Pseudomonadota bacterium]
MNHHDRNDHLPAAADTAASDDAAVSLCEPVLLSVATRALDHAAQVGEALAGLRAEARQAGEAWTKEDRRISSRVDAVFTAIFAAIVEFAGMISKGDSDLFIDRVASLNKLADKSANELEALELAWAKKHGLSTNGLGGLLVRPPAAVDHFAGTVAANVREMTSW